MIGKTSEGLCTNDICGTLVDELDHFAGKEPTFTGLVTNAYDWFRVLYDIVDALVKKVAELDSRLGESNERLEKMSKMSAANPAEIEIETAESTAKINKKFDAALEGIKAARKLKND